MNVEICLDSSIRDHKKMIYVNKRLRDMLNGAGLPNQYALPGHGSDYVIFGLSEDEANRVVNYILGNEPLFRPKVVDPR
jgi:hypothetical protein